METRNEVLINTLRDVRFRRRTPIWNEINISLADPTKFFSPGIVFAITILNYIVTIFTEFFV